MPQVSFVFATEITTTNIHHTPTTSGPIVLPSWAPDIAAMETTVVDGLQSMYLSTTAVNVQLSPGADYTRRCFRLKTGRDIKVGKVLTVDYRSVNELIRT